MEGVRHWRFASLRSGVLFVDVCRLTGDGVGDSAIGSGDDRRLSASIFKTEEIAYRQKNNCARLDSSENKTRYVDEAHVKVHAVAGETTQCRVEPSVVSSSIQSSEPASLTLLLLLLCALLDLESAFPGFELLKGRKCRLEPASLIVPKWAYMGKQWTFPLSEPRCLLPLAFTRRLGAGRG